ncbi:hypothetical protein Tco_1161318 [Tanacetum coccineum]
MVALLTKNLEEVWFTICDENKIFQDFLNTSESSNDNTNDVNAPQEPFVFNQDPALFLKRKSVEDLVLIPSESEGISDSMCDVPFCDNSTPLEASKDHSEILLDSNDDYSSSDDDSLYSEDINYIDALLDSELVSLEEVKDFEDGEIDIDILLTIKDDILHEKLLNIDLLIC